MAASTDGAAADPALLLIGGVAFVGFLIMAALAARSRRQDAAGTGNDGGSARTGGQGHDPDAGSGSGSDYDHERGLWRSARRLEDDLERAVGGLRSVDDGLARIVAQPIGIDTDVARQLASLRNQVSRLHVEVRESARGAQRLADALRT